MNNHLLPFPYNQSRPPTWLDRIVQPLSNIFLSKEPRHSKPEKPSNTPVTLYGNDSEHPAPPPIRINCISDTHNTTPSLPPGDILIHAGDLTITGNPDELQSQLKWLSSQPHRYKIVIAGNHDILLDEGCDAKFLTRGSDSPTKRKKLDWGGIRYLQDEAVTLEIPTSSTDSTSTGEGQVRKVKIYGSPHTPECGSFAFQYPAIRDVWTGQVPDDTDILVVHGPPALYGDCDGEVGQGGNVKVKGDGYLLREIRRVRPRLVVCGHIHGAYGVSVIHHDGIQDVTDGLQMGWEGYGFLGALKQAFWSKTTTSRSVVSPDTLVVNAAIARSSERSEEKSAISIDMY